MTFSACKYTAFSESGAYFFQDFSLHLIYFKGELAFFASKPTGNGDKHDINITDNAKSGEESDVLKSVILLGIRASRHLQEAAGVEVRQADELIDIEAQRARDKVGYLVDG